MRSMDFKQTLKKANSIHRLHRTLRLEQHISQFDKKFYNTRKLKLIIHTETSSLHCKANTLKQQASERFRQDVSPFKRRQEMALCNFSCSCPSVVWVWSPLAMTDDRAALHYIGPQWCHHEGRSNSSLVDRISPGPKERAKHNTAWYPMATAPPSP